MSQISKRTSSGGGGGTVTSFSFTDANGFDGIVTDPTTTPNLELSTSVGDNEVIYANGGALTGTGVGTTGQVLTSNGGMTGPSWEDLPASGTVTSFSFNDANGFSGTVTNATTTPELTLETTVSDFEVIYADSGALTGVTAGTVGQVLTSNGPSAAPSWQDNAGGTQYTNVTSAMSPYSVTSTDYFLSVDSTGGPVVIVLPSTTTANRQFIVKDRLGQSSVNNITVESSGGTTIDQQSSYLFVDNFESLECLFHGTNYEVF